jgi:hypothetical protein
MDPREDTDDQDNLDLDELLDGDDRPVYLDEDYDLEPL